MKDSIILFLFLIPTFLFAQYPTGSNKSRLGWQTTGDGLIWRGVAADTVNKPNNRNYPYFQLDTVNAVLYRYIQTRGKWQPVSESVNIDSLIYATRYWVNSNFFPLQGGLLTGTGGNGFVGFPLQSSPPATPATGFSLFAGSTGNNISWMQPDGFFRRLVSPATGTPRQYQFMARSYTLADSADVAALPTGSGTTNYYTKWTSSTALGIGNMTDNNTVVSILNSKPFQLGQWTTAGRPAGTTGYMGFRLSGINGVEWYQGSRWAYALESTFARGTATRVPFFDANGQVTESSSFTFTTTRPTLMLGTSSVSSTTTPTLLSLGNSISSVAGANPKISMFNNGIGDFLGFGVSSGQLDYIVSSGIKHVFYVNNTKTTEIDGTYLRFPSTKKLKFDGISSSATDPLIDMFGGIYGFGITSGTMNYFVPSAAQHDFLVNGVTAARITSTSNLLLGTTTDVSRRLHVNGQVRITGNAGTPTSIMGKDGSGDLGVLALSGLSISGGTLTAQNIGNTDLTLTGSRTLNSGGFPLRLAPNTTIGGTLKVASLTNHATPDSIVTTVAGVLGKKKFLKDGNNYYDGTTRGFYSNDGYTGFDEFSGTNYTGFHAQPEYYEVTSYRSSGSDYSSMYGGLSGTGMYNTIEVDYGSNNGQLTLWNDIGLRLRWNTGSGAYNIFTVDIPGTAGFGRYGAGNKEAGDLSKTVSAYLAGFATDGTLLDYPISSLATTWLKPELEAGRDVDITGGTSTDFRLRSNTRTQFDGKFKIGSDSTFVHDPAQDTTYAKGTVRIKSGSLILQNETGGAYMSIQAQGAGNKEAGILMESRGTFGNVIYINGETLSTFGVYNLDKVGGGGLNMSVGEAPGFTGMASIGDFTVTDSTSNSANTDVRFKFDSRGDARFYQYGTGTKEAADLSKTQSGYIAGFATDGTITELEGLHVDSTELVTFDSYTSSAPFTAPALGIDAGEFFGGVAYGGEVIQRKIRETTWTNSNASITDDMLELAQDVFMYANCPAIATDSTVVDLPTPSVDYIGQVVEVCGDGRNSTPNYQVYVRGIGATLWHQNGGADPSAQTYLEVTNLSSNHNTVRFICAQPSGSTYYWILLKQ